MRDISANLSFKKAIIVSLISSFFALSLTVLIFLSLLKTKEPYGDLVLGDLAILDQSKTADYTLFIVFFITFLLFFFGIMTWMRMPSSKQCLYKMRRISHWAGSPSELISDIILINLFTYFSIRALFVTILPFVKEGTLLYLYLPKGFMLCIAIITNGIIIWNLWSAVYAQRVMHILRRSIFLSQLLIPFNLIQYLSVKVSGYAGSVEYSMEPRASFFIWIFIIGGFIWNILRRDGEKKIFFTTAVSIGAILCIWDMPLPSLIPPYGHFHLGERLNPYYQLINLSQRYYHDYMPTLGLLGVFTGAVNAFAYGGKIVTFTLAKSLGNAFFSLINIGIAYRAAGPYAALILAFSFSMMSERFLWVPFISLLLLSGIAAKRSYIWLLAFAFFSIIHLAWHLPAGIALTLSFLPFAFMHLKVLFQKQSISRSIIYTSFLVLFTGFLLLYFSPVRGAIQFFIDAGRENVAAYGIVSRWFESFDYFSYQGFVMAGAALSIITLFIIFIFDSERNSFSGNISIVGLLFFLFIIPYSMGRIDPNILTRIGYTVRLYLLFFIPSAIVTLDTVSRKRYFYIIFPVIMLSTIFNFQLSGKNILGRRTLQAQDGSQFIFINGEREGFRRLGTGYVEKRKFEELLSLRDAIARLASPDDAFYDFSDQQALYSFLDKRAPAPHDSPYSTVTYKMQKRVIDALKTARPAVILVSSKNKDNILWNPSLRCYRVYRYLILEGYKLHEEAGFSFLIRKDRLEKIADSEIEAERLALIFAPDNLEMLSNAWGRNFARLERRFNKIELRLFQKDAGSLHFGRPINGREADFIFLRLKGPLRMKMYFNLSWLDSGGNTTDAYSMKYSLNQPDALIPLGANPLWLLNDNLTELRVTALIDDNKVPVEIEHAQLLKLVK